MMTTPTLPKQPHLYVTLEQVRDSHLLSPARMAEVEAEIERRISTPVLPDGTPISTCRAADLSPWGIYVYPRMNHEHDWDYMRRDILSVVLTEGERKLVEAEALNAASARRDAERFEKAQKVPAAEYTGMVTDGDGNYWDSVADYMDEAAGQEQDWEGSEEAPARRTYLWPTKPSAVITGRDVDSVFESQMCDNGPEDMTVNDLKGVDTLQKALDEFVAANADVVAYWPDYTRAIILP